ncbi:glycosyltransferase family 4 protein [Psychrobacillus sp. NEAU-3TGS]|uniref:glycosyltransferase family 4 protein n=1 Tax=Psychrobacillus sp. NEAU-3TGS TaxID=2995412 RepID=UPI00249975CC|nr:glycosyltransferase family 4 protein [Psychrobacillus sp. NEAU-3TGS]MDI2588437.1 glycosyltransferase family 4 protein [Psychrobacillus sp. NEAU-3TGS]
MKIGLFSDTFYPQINGVANSVLILKENLEMFGHEVYVFTTTDPKASNNEKNVYRMPSIPFASARRLGMFYHPRLVRFIKSLELDIIHTHTEFSLGIFGRAMARKFHIPLLHTYHTIYEDYTHYIVKFRMLDFIAKNTARKISANFCNSVDRVIVPTEKVRDLLFVYNVERPIFVVPTGIELNKFANVNKKSATVQNLRADLEIEADDQVLLYIGRISEEKNIAELLLSLKCYLAENASVKFVLVGDGPERNNLEELTKQLGIDKQTLFIGERPWDEIGIYYQLGDVFISASQSETQGLTYIEALASALPIVAKADRCLDGVLQNDVNGYVFYGTEDFVQSIDRILDSESKKERLSLGAIQSVERYSATYFAQAIEAMYEGLLDEHKKLYHVS